MLKRRRHEEPENHERWIVSYADFITLMFAFFTILFATSEQNTEKAKKFEQSIRQHLIKFGAMGDSGEKINQGVEYNSPIEHSLKQFPEGSHEAQKLQKKIESIIFSKKPDGELEKAIRDISPDVFGLRITIAADDIFDRGSVQMKHQALPILDQLAEILKKTNRRIIIEGYSDDVPRAKDILSTAWELSSLQATKILRYFMKVHDMDATKMASVAFGDQKPLPPYNRRIDILITTEDIPY